MRVAALALALVLAACASSERIAAERAEADRADCAEMGFTPGTERFADCLLRLRAIRAQEQYARAVERERRTLPLMSHRPWYGSPWYGPWYGPPGYGAPWWW